MTIDTTRLRADAEAVRDAGVTLHTASNRVAKLREDVGPSQLLTDAHREHRGAAEALRGAQKRLYADAPPDGIILALLDEVERLRALVAALEPSPMPASADDTRDWYWREDDNETTPNGPYATREAALADVPGYYAVGEMPERVLVGRCTDPLSLVTLDAEDVREMLRDRLMGICDMDVSIHDQPRADDALDTWIREHVVCEWEWVTDPKEEWVDVAEPQEGGER